MKVAGDVDLREFLLRVSSWPREKPIRLTVAYFACVGDKLCDEVRQQYVLHLQPDREGEIARGKGAGYWDPDEFARHALTFDRNGDGKVSKSEAQGLILPHFASFDTNGDGLLDYNELKAVARWLNRRHQAGSDKQWDPK